MSEYVQLEKENYDANTVAFLDNNIEDNISLKAFTDFYGKPKETLSPNDDRRSHSIVYLILKNCDGDTPLSFANNFEYVGYSGKAISSRNLARYDDHFESHILLGQLVSLIKKTGFII